MNNFKYVVKIVLPLLIICAAVVAVLAAINALTSPVIEENNKKALNDNMTAFYGEGIEASSLETSSFDPSVKKAYRVLKEGELAGYCFDVTGSGAYKGKIEVLVALDASGKIVGISNVKNGETPSIGGKVLADGSVKDSYVGLSYSDSRPVRDDYMISGATRTSTALNSAVINAFNAYSVVEGDGLK